MDGWVDVGAGLRIAYSNQQRKNPFNSFFSFSFVIPKVPMLIPKPDLSYSRKSIKIEILQKNFEKNKNKLSCLGSNLDWIARDISCNKRQIS